MLWNILQCYIVIITTTTCSRTLQNWHWAADIASRYRPQRSCGQGNIFAPVCHSVHRGVSASVHAGIPPPSGADTPRSRHPPKQTPPQADTPEADTPQSRHPPKQTPQADTPLRSRHPPRADIPRSRHAAYSPQTRKHSSSMRTACFGPQPPHVCSRGVLGLGACTVGSHVWREEALYSEVQCIMGNGLMGPSPPRRTDRHTRLKTLPSRNFFGGR